jgi:hypothetical protein
VSAEQLEKRSEGPKTQTAEEKATPFLKIKRLPTTVKRALV